jgi:hypothetical protein
VSKARLDNLRANKPVMNAELHLRPDGGNVVYVHSSIEAERLGELNRGDRIMQLAHNQLVQDMQKARQQGLKRVQFNQKAQAQDHTDVISP